MRRIRLLTRDGTKLNTRSDAATSVLHLSESLKRLVRSKLALQRFVGAISAYAIGVHFLNRHAIEQFVQIHALAPLYPLSTGVDFGHIANVVRCSHGRNS
jgi:hypothetical protein